MKKTAISLIALGIMIVSKGYAQESIAFTENPSIDDKIVTKHGQDFISQIQNSSTPKYTKYFETLASQWGKKKVNSSGPSEQPFSATFKTEKGDLTAKYSTEGELIGIKENFKNVALPEHIIIDIYKKHQEWIVKNTNYIVDLGRSASSTMKYEIELQKGEQQKNITINVSDEAANSSLKSMYATSK